MRMPSRDLERDLAALCQHSIELGLRVLVAAGEKRRDDADHVVPLHAADANNNVLPRPDDYLDRTVRAVARLSTNSSRQQPVFTPESQ